MIDFLRIPYRAFEPDRGQRARSIAVGVSVGLLLASQVGLLVWAMIR